MGPMPEIHTLKGTMLHYSGLNLFTASTRDCVELSKTKWIQCIERL